MIEQDSRLARFQLSIGKACEVKYAPETVASVGEVEPDQSRSHARIDSTEDDLQRVRNYVWESRRICFCFCTHTLRSP